VEQAVRESGVRSGLVRVNAMRVTASAFINDEGRMYCRMLRGKAPTGTVATKPASTPSG
jgi:hypothetical protein